MKRFFAVFTIFLLFLTGFPEITPCPGSEKAFLRHPTGSRDNFHTGVFAARLKSILRNILQEKAPYSTQLSIRTAPAESSAGKDAVTLQKISGRMYLFLPSDFDSFIRNRKAVSQTVSLALLASLGLPAEYWKKISSSFPVAAITYDLSETFFLQTMPYSSYTPGAALLTSYGIYPDLERIFSVPLPPDYAAGDLYGEYSTILLSGILKRKLFSGSDFESLLRHACENGTEKQTGVIKYLIRKNLKKEKSGNITENAFFHSVIRKNLSNALQVLSVEELEKQYSRLTVFEAEDLSGKKRKFTLPDFAKNVREVKNGEFLSVRFLQELLLLSRKAPGNTGNGLLWLRQNIIRAKTFPVQEGQELIDRAEQQFFRELEKHSAIEGFLSASEKFAVTPGARFFRTMELLQAKADSVPHFPWGSEMEKLLNDTVPLLAEGDGKLLQ